MSSYKATVIPVPPTDRSNSHYVTNQPPLRPDPLVKLPLGAVIPKGWLAHQLGLMTAGMTGQLPQLSKHLKEDNGWLGGSEPGWEEQPYWLRGFHDLAVLSGKEELLSGAKRWVEALFASQDPDGYFGPAGLKNMAGKDGKVIHDLWPHMVAVDALISHYEHTGDQRVVDLLTRFFRFCYKLPDEQYLPRVEGKNYRHYPGVMPFWQDVRAGDFLPQIYWVYNVTQEPWLLELAVRTYGRIRPPGSEWLDHHIVNFTQRFVYPAAYHVLTHDPRHLRLTEYWYEQHLQTWGQQPRGIFGADEVIRKGCVDPRQGFETCGMVEFAKSFYLLGRITGKVLYADRCEDIMLNHFPAALTPDLKALHYLTASNQPQLDDTLEHEYSNKGRQIIYSPHIYRCCQHNVAMGWPWYAQNLWQATADNGLALWLHAASEVTASVGEKGTKIMLDCRTDYPFGENVEITVAGADREELFPLYLRVPGWCRDPRISIDGRPAELAASGDATDAACGFIRIERKWQKGDRISLELPMEISLTEWPRNGSLSVDRGPLSYSIRIEEEWKRCGGTDEWPEWEVIPASPWNYGLVVDRRVPGDSIRVSQKRKVEKQPWTMEAAPIELAAKVKKIPKWGLENETVSELQQSPVKSGMPEEEIKLIPLGCARLRLACLPRIGDSPDAREWE